MSLIEARKGFKSKLIPSQFSNDPVEKPPAALFQIVQYESPAGKLAAYLTPDPQDGKQHPAIIWITGGDCNSIGDVWSPGEPDNDQTAAAYRQAGIVMMFPSLRGGNNNPGTREGFLGEVDDVIAAVDFLAKTKYVDPKRIYLGGHSTGGTLALLVAECSDRFRATFSFGPVGNVSGYGKQYLPFDSSRPVEIQLRSPARWLRMIKTPTFVFEGESGNSDELRTMSGTSKNPNANFFVVSWADHFQTLAPINRHIADKILHDDGPTCNLKFTSDELNKLMKK